MYFLKHIHSFKSTVFQDKFSNLAITHKERDIDTNNDINIQIYFSNSGRKIKL